jgi:cytochrome c oxidase cbb3-type subunit I/II
MVTSKTVTQIMPMYWMRAIGGTLYLIGMFTLVYNIIQTVRLGSKIEDELAMAPELIKLVQEE